MKIIRKATDGERYKFCKLLAQYIEDRLSKLKLKKNFYDIDDCKDKNVEILEYMQEIKLKNKVNQTMSVETACGLVMQLLRTRERHNVRSDDLDDHEDDITSDEIRRIIQDQGCQQLYDLIYEHLLNVIEMKKSTINLCSRYLSEALLNHNDASVEDKKYVENSIGRSIKREISRRELNKSNNPKDKFNKQFSPTNSDEGGPAVVLGMNKKKKNKDFDLKFADFGIDDSDKQALEVESIDYDF